VDANDYGVAISLPFFLFNFFLFNYFPDFSLVFAKFPDFLGELNPVNDDSVIFWFLV